MNTKPILKWILMLVVLTALVATPFGAVQAQDEGPVSSSTGQARTAIADRISGIWPTGTVTMARPTFKWDKNDSAVKYQLLVYSYGTSSYVLNVMVDDSYCGGNVCAYTPNKIFANGDHGWRVRAKSSTTYGPYSYWKYFTESKNGFNSEFNGSYTGWSRRSGATWGIYNSSYFYTKGISSKSSTAKYATSYTDFVFTARTKWASNTSNSSGLLIRGDPSTLDSIYDWKNCYYFGIKSSAKQYVVYQVVSGVWRQYQPVTESDYIFQNDWNVLRVVAADHLLAYYINDHLVWADTDASFGSGYVGFRMKSPSTATGFYVDWATLGVLPNAVGLKGSGFEGDTIDPEQARYNAEALKNPTSPELDLNIP